MSNRSSDQYKVDDPLEQLVEALPPLTRHPGVWIRDVILPEWGLGISELSRLINVNRANLSEVLSGKRDVSRELAYRLGALFNDHVADLVIAYQQAWDIEQERGRREEIRRSIARLPEPS
jgi:addiction module HigA family antidote